MTQDNTILQELIELGSTLPHANIQTTYSVPDGYFEGLTTQVLNRIKAMEAGNAADELSALSPLLAGASKQVPYEVPAGYFTGLDERMLQAVNGSVQTVQEELESISPLLGSLKKETPYHVPSGYFEGLNATIKNQEQSNQPVAKVVSMTSRKWFRYAAAAVIVGVVASTFFIISKRSDPVKRFERFEAKLDKEIKKTSDKELADFIEFTDAGQDVAVSVPKEEVKEMLKDVPATELQNFLDEIADPGISSDDNVSMEE
jgi:hypothetical protein